MTLRTASTDLPRISVIVCTRDRVGRLDACLGQIAASGREAAVRWELVAVDNGSADGTREFLERWSRAVDHPIVVASEPRLGLSAARNAGVRAARGSVLAFVDDDCLVERAWMRALATAHDATPTPDLVGGRVDLDDQADASVAIRPFEDAMEIEDFGALSARLIGCNFSVNAASMRAVGEFDERLGAGTAAQAAEDFDLFYRLLRAGKRLRYDPTVRVRHAHGRRDPAHVAALRRGYVRGAGALYAKHLLAGDTDLLRRFYWDLRALRSVGLLRELLAGMSMRMRGG